MIFLPDPQWGRQFTLGLKTQAKKIYVGKPNFCFGPILIAPKESANRYMVVLCFNWVLGQDELGRRNTSKTWTDYKQ